MYTHTHTLSPPQPRPSAVPSLACPPLPLGLPALSHQGCAAGSAPPGPLGAGNFPLRPAPDENPGAGCPAARVILAPDARPGHSPLPVLRVLPPPPPSAAVPPAPRAAAAPPGQRAPGAPSRRLSGLADNCGHTSKPGYPSTPRAPFTEEFLTSQPIGGDLLTKVPNRSGRPSPRPTHGLRLPVAAPPSCPASQLEAVLSASPNSRRSATRRRRLGPVVLDSRFGPARPWTPRLPPQMPRSSAQAVAAPGPPMGFGLRRPRDGHSRPSPQV